MQKYQILNDITFDESQHKKAIIHENKKYKVLRLTMTLGNKIPPCTMYSDTIFYVVEGCGKILTNGVVESIKQGTMIIIPAGLERSIECESETMIVTAIQIHCELLIKS